MKNKLVIIIFMVLLVVISGCSGNSDDTSDYTKKIPELKGRMNDYADLFNQETRDSIENQLKRYETKTSTQIVILTVKNIGDATIEEYSYKIAYAWKIGQKEKNNGILITVAEKQKKVRIETGYGVEGVLPDATCSYIIRHCFLNNVSGRSKDFDAAIKETVDAIILSLGGEFQAVQKEVERKDSVGWCIGILFFLTIIIGFIGYGADSWLVSGLSGMVIYPIIWIIFWGFDPLIVLGLAILGFTLGVIARYIAEIAGESSGGSGGYSYGSSSNSGSGGFFGGGGSFGGGGCSGGW